MTDVSLFGVADLQHLLGQVDQISVARRDLREEDNNVVEYLPALSTAKVRVFAYKSKRRNVLVFSPAVPYDRMRQVVYELSRITHKPSEDNPITVDEMMRLRECGIRRVISVNNVPDPTFQLLTAASSRMIRVFVCKQDISTAKLLLPYHTVSETEHLVRQFLERSQEMDLLARLDDAQKRGKSNIVEALRESLRVLEVCRLEKKRN